MIVIESGGTKSSWCFRDEINGENVILETVGLHPRELDENKKITVKEHINKLPGHLSDSEIFFYGAGCEKEKGKHSVITFLKEFGFSKIVVNTDIKGSCVALLGNNAGYVGILGTGAIAAEYNGKEVTKQTSGLGHLIGDEGSGFDIGKRMLNTYFNAGFNKNLERAIKDYFAPEEDIIHRIYQPDGRRIIAGLTFLAREYREDKIIQLILNSAFEDYYHSALKTFNKIKKIGFIGSVAYYFQDELREVLESRQIEILEIHKSAINALFDYHFQQRP